MKNIIFNIADNAILTLLLLMVSSTITPTAYGEAYQYYPNSPIHLGSSFDPRRIHEVGLKCIDFDSRIQLNAYDSSNNLAMETQYTVDQVKTRRQLYNYLHVSASVSGHYSFFSGGGSYDLIDESSFDSDSFSWVIRGYTKYGEFGMLNPRLSPEAKKLIGNPVAFRARCGTEFVGQESRSVLIAAVYTVKNLSENKRKEITASFNASVGTELWGVGGKAKYEKFFKEALSSGSLSFRLYIIGGGGIKSLSKVAINTGDIEKVKKIISDYTKELTMEKSVPTDFLTGSLKAFYPDLGSYDFGLYNQFLEDSYLEVTQLRSKRSRLGTILRNLDDYNLESERIEKLEQYSDEIGSAINTITSRVIDCRNIHDTSMKKLQSESVQSKLSQTCTLDSKLRFKQVIKWPPAIPYKLQYWTDSQTHYPQVFVYFQISGQHISEVQVISSEGKIKDIFPIKVDEEGNKAAFGAIEYSKISDVEKPLSLSVIMESGSKYSKVINYVPESKVTAAIVNNKLLSAADITEAKVRNSSDNFDNSSTFEIEGIENKDARAYNSIQPMQVNFPSKEALKIIDFNDVPKSNVPHKTSGDIKCKGKGTFCIRKVSTSNVCYLQKTEASPLGQDYLGPFNKKDDAIEAMCNALDSESTDSSKCWSVMPESSCK
ncbi:hypothetical protein P3564_00845 [Vibrio parahaemolyticus]|nr:hypothetical protein [Vibrio parahaemolyticus]